ncbi:hypothetical protein LRP88_14600 [Fusarium phalaenopsidis]
MQARQQHAFIEEADEWTILTSFFLFVAHDNLIQPKSASYYLREAIGFVEALRLGEPESYMGLDADTEQRQHMLSNTDEEPSSGRRSILLAYSNVEIQD